MREPQGKARARAKSSDRTKPTPPHGTCFEYWEHGKCSVNSSGATCKWEHVKANSPEAKAFIAKAKTAAAEKEKADKAGGNKPKPKTNIACKYIKLGKCEKGKSCKYSHAGNAAAPAIDPKNEQQGNRARKATTNAALAEEVNAVAGAGPTFAEHSSDSS